MHRDHVFPNGDKQHVLYHFQMIRHTMRRLIFPSDFWACNDAFFECVGDVALLRFFKTRKLFTLHGGVAMKPLVPSSAVGLSHFFPSHSSF